MNKVGTCGDIIGTVKIIKSTRARQSARQYMIPKSNEVSSFNEG